MSLAGYPFPCTYSYTHTHTQVSPSARAKLFLEVRDIPVSGFAGSAGVVSRDTFLIRKAGKRTEGSSSAASFVLRRWLSLARRLPPTKTESIQLPDGEIDTETLSPVSLYNCINSFLQPPLLIFLPHQPWQEMPYRRFLVSFWDDLLSHGVARSHPLLRGQTRGVGLLPPMEIETAPGHSAPPDVSRNCVAKRRGQSVFGSLVCPGGGQGGLGGW